MNNENLELFDRMVIALEANYAPLEVYHLKDKGDIKLGDPAAKRTKGSGDDYFPELLQHPI